MQLQKSFMILIIFTDMIADETIAADGEALIDFLSQKGHPALGLDPLM